jgi:hypothetical protein
VIAVWNATPELPAFKGQNPHLRRDIANRWSDPRFRDRWRDTIAALARSDHHRGKNDGTFIAILPWFLSDRGWEASAMELERQDARGASKAAQGLHGPSTPERPQIKRATDNPALSFLADLAEGGA